MPQHVTKFCLVILLGVSLAGCTGSKIGARTYIDERERVDQDMGGGNYGYLMGTPMPEDRSDIKKTRKVYVLEVTKEPNEPEVEIVLPERKPATKPARSARKRPRPERIVLPIFDENKPEVQDQGEAGFVTYEVQKDDTLQKISKKFYDSFSKWPKIYDVNKEVIKDPNKIKKGMTLRIPVE